MKFATRKTLALLIYLVLEGGTHSREKLAALLWPESDARRGRGSLRNTLGYLRAALKPAGSPLRVDRQSLGYDFEFPYQADIQTVEVATQALHTGVATIDILERALEAYSGDFLDGFSLGDAPEFDNWASLERESWHHRIVALCSHLARTYEVSGDFDRALAASRRWLALDPYNESAYQGIIRLHFAAGERTAALEAYAALQDMLEGEFGAGPSPETEALVASLRARAASSRDVQRPAVSPKLDHMPFVGRAAEHTALVGAYHAARQGHPQVALIIGEGGIGKTRLAAEFLSWVSAQGADVLRGRNFEAGGQLPYQAITRALRSRLESENAPEDLLSDTWLAELSRLLPELRDRYPDLPAATRGEAARARLFEAVARLIQALAGRSPLVLFLDDLQWSDLDSLDLLRYALENWVESGSPVLLLLNLRVEALPRLQTWLLGLQREGLVTQLNLESLQLKDARRLVEQLLEPESQELRVARLSQWLFDKTGGQPFFISETLKALADQKVLVQPSRDAGWVVDWSAVEATIDAPASQMALIPSHLRALIVSQLAALSPAGSTLLNSAAVLGGEAGLERLCEVAGLDEMQGLAALDELLDRRLLLESQESHAHNRGEPCFLFSHDQIRDIAYQEAGEARRRVLHRRAFEALQASSASTELAHHASCAGLLDQAFHHSLSAGDEAMHVFAIGEAVTHYESAREVGQQADVPLEISASNWSHLYTQLGRAYELLNDWGKAQGIYASMLEFARTGEHAGIECQALNRLASVQVNGYFDQQAASDLLEQALAVAAGREDQLGLAETEWNLAMLALAGDRLTLARHHAGRALDLVQEFEQPDLVVRILSTLAYTNLRLRNWRAVIEHSQKAVPYYANSRDRAMQADFLRQAGLAQLFMGQLAEAVRDLRKAYTISLAIENPWGEADGASQLANGLLETGSYGEAWRLLQPAVPLARATGHPHLIAMSLTFLGKAQRFMMALEDARGTQQNVLAAQVEGPSPLFPDWAAAELCAVCALVDDWQSAYNYARKALDVRQAEGLLPVALTEWHETEALLRGGDVELARSFVDQLGASIGDNPRYRISYLRSLAVLAQWDDDLDRALVHLEQANSLAGELGLPGESWGILAALGNLYRSNENEGQAHRSFSRAAEILEMLAEKIEDDELRAGFLSAPQVKAVFEGSKTSSH